MRHSKIIYGAISAALFLSGHSAGAAKAPEETPALSPSCAPPQEEQAGWIAEPDKAAARIEACTRDLSKQNDPLVRGAILMARSEAYYETKAKVRALADIEAAAKLLPETGAIAAWRSVVFSGLGFSALGRREADLAIAQQFTPADVYTLRGANAAFSGDFGPAITDLNFALSQVPNDVPALIARGYAEAETGELDQAIRDYDHAEADCNCHGNVAEVNDIFYLLRGRAHFALDQYQAALADFQRSQIVNPDPGTEDAIKDVMAAMSAPSVAIPATSPNAPSQAVGSTHTCAAYYPYLSELLREPGDVLIHYDVSASGAISSVGIDKSSGIDRLDQAAAICVTHHWRNTPAMQNGVAVASPGHRALIHFVAPETPSDDDTRARTLASLGRYDDAIAAYNQILKANPKSASMLVRRGILYYVLQDYAASRDDFDQAMRLKPGLDDAIAGRELVRIATGAK